MKLELASSLLLLSSLQAAAGDSIVASGSRKMAESSTATCECQPVPPQSPSYLAARLWNIVDQSVTPQDVASDWQTGFAPIITKMEGFQRYTQAFTGNTSTFYAMNQFATKEESLAAQEAAREYLKTSSLNGKMEPNLFLTIPVLFVGSVDACITAPSTGQYLGARFFNLTDPTSTNTTEFYSLTEHFYNSSVKDKEGFVEYQVAANPPDQSEYFALDIFQTEEEAVAENEVGVNADVNCGDFCPPERTTLTYFAGEIVYDYLCAAGNATSHSAAFSAKTSGVVFATAVFMMFWKVF